MTISFYLLALLLSEAAAIRVKKNRQASYFYSSAIIMLVAALAFPLNWFNITLASLVTSLFLEFMIPSQQQEKLKLEHIRAFKYFTLSSLIIHIYNSVSWIPYNDDWGEATVVVSFLGVLLLDLKNYWLHRLQHKYNWWWKIHFVHHNQKEINVFSSGPVFLLEWITLRLIVSSLIVWMLSLPQYTVTIYAYFSVVSGVWSHANIKLSNRFSSFLECFLVTPRYHRNHHINDSKHERSNYGDIFTFWDRLFFTYEKPLVSDKDIFYNNSLPKYESVLKEQCSVFCSLLKALLKQSV